MAEKYVKVVQDMYEGTKTRVRTQCGDTEEFEVKVGVHQGSALSPFLFICLIDMLSEHKEGTAPWTLIFADDLAIMGKTKQELET